jgi:hypothetical protein
VSESHRREHPAAVHISYHMVMAPMSGGMVSSSASALVITSHWAWPRLSHGRAVPPYRSAAASMAAREAEVNRNVLMLIGSPRSLRMPLRMTPTW